MAERYTRRELLTGRFAHNILAARSHEYATSKEKKRDWVTEKIGESLALASILSLAYSGSRDRLVWFEANAESRVKDLPAFREKLQVLSSLSEIVNPPLQMVASLEQEWISAYYKSRLVPKTELVRQCDSDGDNCIYVPKTTTETEHYWDEPWELTRLGMNSRRLADWRGTLTRLDQLIGATEKDGPEAFVLANPNSVFYEEHTIDTGKQALVAGVGYGLVGSAFIFYEEADKKRAEQAGEKPIFQEGRYIKRRTFLKLGAVFLGALGIRDLQKVFSQNNKQLLDKIKNHTVSVVSRLDAPDEENFQRFFGTSPSILRSKLMEIVAKTEASLSSSYQGHFDSHWPEVRQKLLQMNKTARQSLTKFDDFFQFDPTAGTYSIPKPLTEITKYLWGSREIIAFAESQKIQLDLHHLWNALVLGGGLGAFALLCEFALLPASDTILEKMAGEESHSRSF